jgi:HK97 family phage major capsid protein/HK97 family phage prohead protease
MPSTQTILHRTYAIQATSTDTITFSFSSETPVARSWGLEVLSHAPGAADLSRLNDGAPLLWNHDPGALLGVIEKAQISSGKGRAVARWGSSPEAQQRRADVEAGIIRNVSVGYVIHDMKQQGDQWLVTRWEALEISLVSVPADASVGIGRSHPGCQTMEASDQPMTNNIQADPIETSPEVAELTETVSDLKRQVKLMQLQSRKVETVSTFHDEYGSEGTLPLTRAEQGRYSLINAIRAAATGDWSNAGLERECSRALEQQTGRSARGFMFPANLQMNTRASQYVSTGSTGGNVVETSLLAEQFIDALRKQLRVAELGATMLPGLVGNVAIPRRTSTQATYWVAESGTITAGATAFDQVTMSPKTVGALSSWSRVLELQSTPAIEQLLRQDMVQQVAAAIDLAAINGSGSSNQPRGILSTSGIGSVVGGTNGATITFDALADLKREVAIDDADVPTAAFLTNAKVEAKLSKTQATTGQYIIDPAGVASGAPTTVFGRRFAVSNQVPSNLTKGSASGTCSAVLYGNFADLLIGMWGATDILVNPFGTGYTNGDVEIRIMQTVDLAVRHPESFAAIVDALT